MQDRQMFISYTLPQTFSRCLVYGEIEYTNLGWIPPGKDVTDGICRASECHWMIPPYKPFHLSGDIS